MYYGGEGVAADIDVSGVSTGAILETYRVSLHFLPEGTYLDQFGGGGSTTITATTVAGGTVVQVDWASDTLITEYNGVFSKLKFACYKDDLYYCTVAYNQPTAAAAVAAADTSDPSRPHDTGSCGSFTFTELRGADCGSVIEYAPPFAPKRS